MQIYNIRARPRTLHVVQAARDERPPEDIVIDEQGEDYQGPVAQVVGDPEHLDFDGNPQSEFIFTYGLQSL